MFNEHRHSTQTLELWPVKFKFLGVAGWRLNAAATWMGGRLWEVGAG